MSSPKGISILNIIHKLKKAFQNTNSSEKKSGMTKRFIIAVSVIYSILILSAALFFHYSMNAGEAVLRDTLESYNQDVIGEKIDALIRRLHDKKIDTRAGLGREIRRYNASARDILYLIIFSKTYDENYYCIYGKLPLNSGLVLRISKNAVVRENKKINYLKEGMLHSVIDPEIYSKDDFHWQSVYYPYELNNRKVVLQFLMSVSRTQEAITSYVDSIQGIRLANGIMAGALAVAVIVLTLIFTHNYSLLITNLSRFMKKAVNGDLEVSLNQTRDGELSELAVSFNTLIEELKDKKAENVSDPEGLNTIFNAGVSKLRENRLDEAIAIFKTLTIIKPKGFAGCFNLGVAYAKKGEYREAEAMFGEARAINPSHELTGAYIEKVRRLQNRDA
jgi:tetratricopeptide (TPR) repeat protein